MNPSDENQSDETPQIEPHVPFVAVCKIIANGVEAHLCHQRIVQEVAQATGNQRDPDDIRCCLERTNYWILNTQGMAVVAPRLRQNAEWQAGHESLGQLRDMLQQLLAESGHGK